MLAAGALIAVMTTAPRPASFSATLPGGVPRFYVTVLTAGQHLRAEVHDSASGRVVGSVPVPVSRRSGTTWLIAAAADHRHFAIAVPVYGTSSLAVFGLSLSQRGRPAVTQRQKARWNGDVFQSLALSPDGTVAALAFTNSVNMSGSVAVINLRTGRAKSWSGAQARGFLPGDLSFLSRTRLAVPWIHYPGNIHPVLAGVRMLDVSRPGGSLLAARLISFRVQWAVTDSAIVTAGGRQIVASFCKEGTGRTVTAMVAALSGTDGHVIRVLHTERLTVPAPPRTTQASQALTLVTCPVLAVDSTGRHVLTEAFTFGRLDNGTFRRLRGDSGSFDAAW
jgi:hypothetical protein